MSILTKINQATLFKVITMVAIFVIVIYRTDSVLKTKILGDGIEYILMTEAWYNHASPDIREDDLRHFRESIKKNKKAWDNQPEKAVFESIEALLEKPDKQFMDNAHGFYIARNGKAYSYHFPFYSLLNVPFRAVADFASDHPVSIFKKCNGFFILLACFIILFFSPLPLFPTIVASICFLYSPSFWYHGWPHPEVFTMCFVAAGMWLAFGKRYIPAIVLISLACLQNQPLIALNGIFFLAAIIKYRNSLPKILACVLSASVVMLPGIFYFLNYGTFNLIKEVGFLDTQYLTGTRIWGFYTDLDQGMILAIPLVLIAYPFLWGDAVIRTVRGNRFLSPDIFLPVVMLAITMGVCTMINWNHGQAVINRYASWSSTILLMSAIFFISERLDRKWMRGLLIFVLLTQISTTIYHARTNMSDWGGLHKPIAKWVFRHCPGLYNPEPAIFITRTTHGWYSPNGMPVFYYDDDEIVRKMLVDRSQIDNLVNYGADAEKLKQIKSKLTFVHDWTYIHPPDIGLHSLNRKMKDDINERMIQAVMRNIRGNQGWFQSIQERASEQGITLEAAMRVEAQPYLLFKNQD